MGVISLRSSVVWKARLNAALQRQRPSVTHDASSDDFRIADQPEVGQASQFKRV